MQSLRTGASTLAAASALALGAAGIAAAAPAHVRPQSSGSTRIVITNGFLTTANHLVLFDFTKGNSVSTCTGACLSVWPAFEASRISAGPGVNPKLLGSVKRGNGRQVTYAGHLLYLYANASAGSSQSYVGARQFGGAWDAITGSGRVVAQ